MSEAIDRTFSSALWYGCSGIVQSWLLVTADKQPGRLFYQVSEKSVAEATPSSSGNTGLSVAPGSPPPGGLCVAAGPWSAAVKRLPVSEMKVSAGNWVKVVCDSEAGKDVCFLPCFSVSKFVSITPSLSVQVYAK